MYVGVIWLLFFLIGHLCLIGVWLGEEQRRNVIETRVFERDWNVSLDVIDFCTLGDSEQSWEALMYSIRESTNMHLTECKEI